MSKAILVFASIAIFSSALLWSQQSTQNQQGDMSGMDMSTHDMSSMHSAVPHDMPGMENDGSAHAMQAMEGHHMDMGPHMKMTTVRQLQPGDQEKADQVAQAARKVAEKYTDYKVALADGFQIFMPNRPQKQYHFTNYLYAFEARQGFNPDHPSSLLYQKSGDGYKLIGVMYTAPKYASEDELNSRIPLSIAQWHAHVNLCLPPVDKRQETLGEHPQFGLHGSIATKEACDVAGGRFIPQIFGWMVHVYPFEQKPEDIWSVERQAEHND
ncbi:MAG TPA: hypothetical protein VEH30_13260 [Terriglobales bacterium]|nr:hypothetical protein [Terriglobales bacterium]